MGLRARAPGSVAVHSDTDMPPAGHLAPAKINLFLHIVGRREDGYHLLESLVAFASVGDIVEVSTSNGTAEVDLTITGPFAGRIDGTTEDNLIVRAARALCDTCPESPGRLLLHLVKNLPVAAGIGGGSADAAATLLAVNQRLKTPLPLPELQALGLSLGADVPVCLAGTPIMMRGIGERLSPAFVPEDLGVVLVNPDKPLATPDVFQAFRRQDQFQKTSRIDWSRTRSRDHWFDLLRTTGNSLQPPALTLLPEVGLVLQALAQTADCRLSRMSGSGATCFGLYDTRASANQAKSALQSRHPDWWIAAGALLP